MATIKVVKIFSCVLVVLAILASCGGKPTEPEAVATHKNIEKSYKRGPLSVRVSTDRESLSIAETVTLTIYAEIDDSYELILPSLAEGTGGFGILDYTSAPRRLLDNDIIAVERSFILEPFLSGEYVIPPLEFRFTEKSVGEASSVAQAVAHAVAPAAEKADHILVTEEISLQVTSILPEDFENLELKDIAGPATIPGLHPRTIGFIVTFSALGAAAVGFLIFFTLKKRKKSRLEIAIPPHEAAYRALQALLSENLIERGETKRFYERVSAVLREYIENRFGIHAPERTTEEFLIEITDLPVFSTGQKGNLGAFLKACDLVKFAEHRPSNEDIQRTFDTCKEFVLAEASDAVS